MTTINVTYIGTKERKDDNVAGSGVTWLGHGDTQPVPLSAWGALSKHPGVWMRADEQRAPLALGQGTELSADQIHGILFPSEQLAEKAAATTGEVTKASSVEPPRRRRAAATTGEVS